MMGELFSKYLYKFGKIEKETNDKDVM